MTPDFQSSVDYIMILNNYLGRTKQLSGFRWQLTQDGLLQSPKHHAIAQLNGEMIGSGSGESKNIAKKNAAFSALVHLGQL
ncbi:hypothetical protein PENSPDRAFT_683494 [Peniophora sp. CONT]|nr:hypothetical protein PENSPDRAFT_683494 [Peniophora sp. CONT]